MFGRLFSGKRKSKFNNKKVIYQNIKFDSILECSCYKVIKKQCILKDLKLLLQVPYQLTPKYKYIADFVIQCMNSGRSLIIDAKGFETDIFKLKSELMTMRHQKVHCAKTPAQAYKLVNDFFK